MARGLDDSQRLTVLRDLAILDTPAEPAYDDLAQLAAVCCGAPAGAVNFVDDVRHWSKATVGVEGGAGGSVPASLSFCAATVSTEARTLVVPDTKREHAWRDHPAVTGPSPVGFYAGAAIIVHGQPIGVVCAWGDQPRAVSDAEHGALVALAGQAASQLELRESNIERTRLIAELSVAVAEGKQLEAKLRQLADEDPLTGVGSRRFFEEHLATQIGRCRRYGEQAALLLIDLNDFKPINDRHGHQAGDQMLRAIAETLKHRLRASDRIARVGGDEFAILLPQIGPDQLEAVLKNVRDGISETTIDVAGGLSVTASIGVALLDQHVPDAYVVIAEADRAMYSDKQALKDAAAGEKRLAD